MRPLSFLLLAINAFAAPAALGAVTDEDFETLRQQLSAMSQRLDTLAAENAALKRSQAQAGTDVAEVRTGIAEVRESAARSDRDSWADSVRLDGDFRYRYEKIDIENTGGRTRDRIRARVNIRADLVEDVEVGFGLATGGNDPVSTNQTIGAGGSSKNVMLNLAYADWVATDNLHLIAGKYKNPLLRVGKQALMWDSDWTPEGLAMTYRRDWLFVNAIGTWLESDSNRGNDHFSWGGQVGVQGQVGTASLKGGVTYYSIKAQGESTTFGDPGDPNDYYGNSAIEAGGLACGTTPGANCTFLYDYLLTEVFAEAAFNIGDWPSFVFFDYVTNSDAPDNNTAWTMGARIGQAKDHGQMGFSYYYASKEADSMLGLLTDSDFGGGGTNNRGHFLKFTYGMNKSWYLAATYFINEININSGNKGDYNRLQLDAQWKWK
jgi:putative porin